MNEIARLGIHRQTRPIIARCINERASCLAKAGDLFSLNVTLGTLPDTLTIRI